MPEPFYPKGQDFSVGITATYEERLEESIDRLNERIRKLEAMNQVLYDRNTYLETAMDASISILSRSRARNS